MKMVDDRKNDDALEALFSAARAHPPEIADDFLARLEADGDAAVPRTAPVINKPVAKPLFGDLRAWFAASGLSGAAALGMWIGFVMPEMVNTVALSSEEIALYTFLPGADLTAPALGE
ncbi:MAG: hypothetical protein AAGF55_13600 [Pseudomonadota bacterium]